MQKETILQENLRNRIQQFLYYFQEENDLENLVPDNIFLTDLIKKGIVVNNTQLPDLYSKLRIPIDKRKAFCFGESGKYYSHLEKGFDAKINYANIEVEKVLCKDLKNHSNAFTENNFKNKIYNNKRKLFDYFNEGEKILYPLEPFQINMEKRIKKTILLFED